MIRFVHISDTHLGASPDKEVCERNTARYFRALVKYLGALTFSPSFVVHTGDVANDREAEALILAREIVSRLALPVFFVAGNHDESALMWRHLAPPISEVVRSPSGSFTYSFERDGEVFVVLDGSGGREIDPNGLVRGADLTFLEERVSESARVSVFTHFPLFSYDCPWADTTMPILNGAEVHAILARHSGKVRGVFHGHMHRSSHCLRDGILYSCVASVFCQFTAWPVEHKPQNDHSESLRFNLVTLSDSGTLVKEFSADMKTPR
jgi:Icc protein